MSKIWEENKDYMSEMEEYEASGNLQKAAIAEKKRNAKIDDLGLNYEKTDRYSEYLPYERKEFEYDYTKDNTYKALAKQYSQNAQRAVQDTMGNYAGMTGGLPSTAAVGAAAQAGGRVMNDLTERIPELEALAYQKYADRENARYNQYRDNQDMNYKLRRDAIEDERYETEWDYKVAEEQDSKAYKRLTDHEQRGLNHWQLTGDPGGLPDEWYTPEAKQMLAEVWQKAQNDDDFKDALNLASDGVPLTVIFEKYPQINANDRKLLTFYYNKAIPDVVSSYGPGAKIQDREEEETEYTNEVGYNNESFAKKYYKNEEFDWMIVNGQKFSSEEVQYYLQNGMMEKVNGKITFASGRNPTSGTYISGDH